MRRGLMGWNADELPVAALEARLARLRAAMAKAGMDAFVLYTNNVRPSAVTWVTGFTPYWSDALLLVGRTGAPAFATALSKRVSEWIKTTDPVSEIVNTPKPGALIGERLAKDPRSSASACWNSTRCRRASPTTWPPPRPRSNGSTAPRCSPACAARSTTPSAGCSRAPMRWRTRRCARRKPARRRTPARSPA